MRRDLCYRAVRTACPDSKKAKALKLTLFSEEQFDCVRNERIAFIRRKMFEEKPKVVVIYGKGQWKYREEASKSSFSVETIEGFPFGIARVESTTVAFAVHPNFARKDAYWVKLGKRAVIDPQKASHQVTAA